MAEKKEERKKYLKKRLILKTKPDLQFLLAVLFINVFGVVMIYSASYYYGPATYGYAPDYFFWNQLKNIGIGLVAMLIISFIRPFTYRRFYPLFALLAIAFCLLVRVPGLRWASHGAYRWIKIGGFTLQVAEPVKLFIILFLASFLTLKKLNRWQRWAIVFGIPGLAAVFLLTLSNNMSTAIIVMIITYVMLMVVYPKPKKLGIVLAIIIAVMIIGLIILLSTEYKDTENFRITRIRAWIDPENPDFINKEAYQPMQALYAIASGKFFGKGLGQSLIKFKLPEPHNDYILAIIFEELGIFGAIILTYLFMYILYKIFRVFLESRDKFSKYIVLGVFLHLSAQITLNYMVTLGLLPTMGVTLPFISAGGSSVIFTLMELGFVIAIARQNEEEKIYSEAFKEVGDQDPYYRQLMEEKKRRKQQKTVQAGKEQI